LALIGVLFAGNEGEAGFEIVVGMTVAKFPHLAAAGLFGYTAAQGARVQAEKEFKEAMRLSKESETPARDLGFYLLRGAKY